MHGPQGTLTAISTGRTQDELTVVTEDPTLRWWDTGSSLPVSHPQLSSQPPDLPFQKAKRGQALSPSSQAMGGGSLVKRWW